MNILDRQNEINSLEIQTTARLLFDRADTINMIQWIIMLSLLFLKFLFSQNIFLNYLMIFWFFTSFILDYYIEKYTDTAAELRKSFDYYVYGWTTDFQEKLLHLSKIYKARNKQFFINQTSNSGTDKSKGVKNWYTTVEKNMTQEKAIRSAMNENIYFDISINKSASFLWLVFVVLLFYSFVSSELSFYEVIFGLFVTFATPMKKVFSTFVNMKKVYTINRNIENLLCSKEADLIYLQSEIDKKRAISGTTSKYIYFFKSKKIHEEISVL